MRCLRIASVCAALPRMPSSPPCTAGCSVLTRPSIISGYPVNSPTSSALSPASVSVLRVPPVETSSTPKPASAPANSTTPDLSETEMRARDARRNCSVMAGPTISQRQPRLLFLTYAPRGVDRGAGMLQAPLHARGGAGMAMDDDLRGAARTFAAGQINAVLKVDAVLVGAECPHLLVRRRQHDAVAVAQPGRLHGRMQVKADGEFVSRRAQLGAAIGVDEDILAVDPHAVGRQHQHALVHNAEAAGVAVMRGA